MRVAKETTKYKMNWKVEFSRTNPFFVCLNENVRHTRARTSVEKLIFAESV